MIYFKIEKSGCCEHNGLVQMRADFYNDEILTECKIIPEEGYSGTVEEFQSWYNALPTEKRLVPFHSHFIYFEPQHTDEEILFCFELALDWRKKDKPMKNVEPVWKESNKSIAETRIAEIQSKDFTTVKNSNKYSVK